ncbi:MAG: F0F1 ATP synthase subunit A [Patescibacteria group bacterium]|nr:F0F1 ATP synthase subunit A [Patescibacteria group bacterium]
MAAELHLAPAKLFEVGGFPVTNSLILSIFTTLVLISIAFVLSRNIKLVPSGMQNLAEALIEGGYNFTKGLAHDKAKAFFPLIATFFLFILISNLMGLLPAVGTIGINDHGHFKPLFRGATSDLNITLGLAIVSIVATHYFAIKYLGIKDYLKKWFSLNPIFLFVGILEIVSEITKMVSLSFRLFGNIFAGEVVLATISGIFAFVAPIPFYMLEVIVSVIQASVFTILTLVFAVILSEKAHH